MKRLVLGVIGHVDHGKTALVGALTGQDTDRLPEEKQRGISIALGFAHLKTDAGAEIDLIDMPGHERFVRTMISGATGIDAVLLVVAANEGIKPQTIEHIDIAGLLGLRRALIAVSKTDLVAPAQAQQVADQAMLLLTQAGLDPLPPVMTSAHRNTGIEALRDALDTLAADQQPRSIDGLAFLPIDRTFSVTGHGPVVTGTLRGAAVSIGDTLELLPSRRRVRIRGLQVHGAPVTGALPGQRVAINLRDVEMTDLERGMALAAPESLALSEWLTISIRSVADAQALRNGMRLRALAGTSEIDVRLRLLDRDVLESGERGFAQLHCVEPLALPATEHVILRLVSPPQTVAGGKVLEPETRRRRRNCPRTLQRLEDLRSLPIENMITAEVQREGPAGTTVLQLSQLSAQSPAKVVDVLQTIPVVVTQSGWVVWKTDMDHLLSRIPSVLAPHATGLSHDKLLAALPGTSAAVLREALALLVSRGEIVERSKQFLIPRPDEDRARALNEAELATEVAEMLRIAGLTPPNPGDIVTSLQSKRAVDKLLREGIVVRAVDRAKGREILFHRTAIDEAQRRLEPLLASPGLLVSEIAAALGISRKFCMPLLDHLDGIHFTRRIHDRRIRADKTR